MREHLGFGGVDGVVPALLVGNAIGGAQIRLNEFEHLVLQSRRLG